LYDRSQARYVTLQEVAALVRGGKSVTIRDSKTSEDLTTAVLMQILMEQHPERMGSFPAPVLHLILRANDAVLGLFREYLRQSQAILEFWQRSASAGPLAAPMEWMKALLSGGPPPAAPPADQALVDGLSRRVADLERRLVSSRDRGEQREADPPARRRPRAARPVAH
jgi:polyhydroxyalkanoate synthesis repressor PhaR